MQNKNKKSDFSENLFKFRSALGLSQRKLAELSGLSQRVISSYENDVVMPPLDNVKSLAKVLNIKIAELLGTDESEYNQNEFLQFDARTMEKLKIILALPKQERYIIYMLAEALLERVNARKQNKTEEE